MGVRLVNPTKLRKLPTPFVYPSFFRYRTLADAQAACPADTGEGESQGESRGESRGESQGDGRARRDTAPTCNGKEDPVQCDVGTATISVRVRCASSAQPIPIPVPGTNNFPPGKGITTHPGGRRHSSQEAWFGFHSNSFCFGFPFSFRAHLGRPCLLYFPGVFRGQLRSKNKQQHSRRVGFLALL